MTTVDLHWIPDNADGSGWADIDWVSAVRGSRYHYQHGLPHAEARATMPAWYLVRTRLDTPLLHSPHENDYFIPAERLSDFLTELALAGGDEQIWHIAPVEDPPTEAHATGRDQGT